MSEFSDVELKDVGFLCLKKLISLFLKKKVGFLKSRIAFFILSMILKMKRKEVVPLATCSRHKAFTVFVGCIE